MEKHGLLKRGLALMLAMLVMLYTLPMAALAEEDWVEQIPEEWLEEEYEMPEEPEEIVFEEEEPEEEEQTIVEEGEPVPLLSDEPQPLGEETLYPVSLTAGTGGTLTADCTDAPAGQWVSLTVTAHTGYYLSQVTLNGGKLMPDEGGQYGFAQPEGEAVVQADFLPCTYQITNLHPGLASGAEQAAYGETVTLTPLEDRAIETLEITAGEQPVTWEESEGVYRFVQPAADVTIRGTFLQKYQTFFDAAGEEQDTLSLSGGTVTRDKRYHLPGETVSITATPAEGMGVRQLDALAGSVLDVTKDGGAYTFTQPEQDVKVTVTFDRLYPVAPVSEGVLLSREAFFAGETVAFTIQPPPGKAVQTVKVVDVDENDYPLTRTEGGYTFRQPETEVGIQVVYEAVSYQIQNTHTGVQVSAKKANFGEKIQITAIAGQYVDSLTVETAEGEPVALEEEENGWFFTQPAADVVVKGTAKQMYRAAFATLKNGTAELEGEYHLPGEEAFFWLTPEEGFDVRSVKAAGKTGAVEIRETELGFVFTQPEEDVKITVTFARRYQVTVTDEAVTVSEEMPFAGEKVTIAVTPRLGEAVSRVSVQGADGSKSRVTKEDDVYCYTQPERDVEVIVTFVKIPYQIQNTHDGVAASAKKACYGDKVLLTPLTDRHVDSLQVLTADGTAVAVEQEDGVYFYYQPASDVTIAGTSRQMYQTVFLSMKNGTATLDAVYHLPGETVTVFPEPEGVYEVRSVVVTTDGEEVPVSATEAGFTFSQPEAKAKVKVTFARRYTVSVEEVWDGTISVSNTEPFPKEIVELRIRPYTGKAVSKVTVQTPEGKKCRVTRSGSLYRFTMPESDVTVSVVFKRSNGSAKTGDNSHIALAGNSMLLSAAGLILLARKRRNFGL